MVEGRGTVFMEEHLVITNHISPVLLLLKLFFFSLRYEAYASLLVLEEIGAWYS